MRLAGARTKREIVDIALRRPTPHVERLDAALEVEEDLALISSILTQALQGFSTDAAASAG